MAEGAAGRIAVVLFNLGGPDSPEAIQPFLYNLFSDPAILTVPQPLRWLLARLIARRRTPEAKQIFARLGGRSPLLDNTVAQAEALAAALDAALAGLGEARVFIAMRYWHPRAEETAAAVRDFDPDRVVLLPLYPQFSTTTTGSSLKEWAEMAERVGLTKPTSAICCFPTHSGFIRAMAADTAAAIRDISGCDVAGAAPVRVLLSAHGLPERVVRAGDPYQWQVEKTAEALAAAVEAALPDLPAPEWTVTYQSRATPEAWLKPDTEVEVERAARAGRAVVVVPIAFVSEHSETLIELDVDYAELAARAGAAAYRRVPTVAAAPDFIAGLAELTRRALVGEAAVSSQFNGRICPAGCSGCPNLRR